MVGNWNEDREGQKTRGDKLGAHRDTDCATLGESLTFAESI